MRKEEIAVFIDATEGMRIKSEEEDVERAYGSKSLEDVLAMQRGVLFWLGGILGKFSNNREREFSVVYILFTKAY